MASEIEDGIREALNELASALGKEAISAVVSVYEENSATQVRQMEEAVIYADIERLRREAHSLKSSSANLGAHGLAEVCLKIEKAQSFDPSIASLVGDCKRLQGEAVVSMRKWRDEP